MSKRMTPAGRKDAILAAAIELAKTTGFTGLRLTTIAESAGCSTATVVNYFSTMKQMRRDVMRHAIKKEVLTVIAAGIACGDPTAAKVDPALRKKAIQSLSN